MSEQPVLVQTAAGTGNASICALVSGKRRFEVVWLWIFNGQVVSKTDRDDDSNDFQRLIRHLDDKVREGF